MRLGVILLDENQALFSRDREFIAGIWEYLLNQPLLANFLGHRQDWDSHRVSSFAILAASLSIALVAERPDPNNPIEIIILVENPSEASQLQLKTLLSL